MNLQILRGISLTLVAITTACYGYQIVYLILPLLKKQPAHGTQKKHRYAILIAARNEERVLPYLLDSICQQDYPQELIDTFVVADNCTDRTAEVARLRGAQVFSRFSRTEIGKGYALRFLLEQIEKNIGLEQYDAFLVFDADNLLSRDYVSQINKTCSDGFQAFCGYRSSKNFGTNWISQGYGLWYCHDACHLNQSRMLLGVSCAVSGTGFGFTRQLLEKCGGWKFFTLTEDIEFNAWCAGNGVRIGYCPDAVLYDEQPENFSQSWRQRTRWTQGGLQVSIRYGDMLLRGMFRGGRQAWSCFETVTLSLWGYSMGAVSGGMTMLVTFLTEQWLGLGRAFLLAITGTYLSLLVVGTLTMLTQRHRIRADRRQKICSVFAFPLFMITFVPIAVTALFRKFQWLPIDHKVAISTGELEKIE